MTESVNELVISIMSGPDDGRVVRFRRGENEGEATAGGTWLITLGRRDDCHLCLPFDTQISRLHARLSFSHEHGWLLDDTGSRNGTFIEKRRIEGPYQLTAGQLFRIGRTWLRLEQVI